MYRYGALKGQFVHKFTNDFFCFFPFCSCPMRALLVFTVSLPHTLDKTHTTSKCTLCMFEHLPFSAIFILLRLKTGSQHDVVSFNIASYCCYVVILWTAKTDETVDDNKIETIFILSSTTVEMIAFSRSLGYLWAVGIFLAIKFTMLKFI